jgi:hypothetical protein
MQLSFIHSTCKTQTRFSFIEYKRQLDVLLFPFTKELSSNLQNKILTDIKQGVVKAMFKGNVSDKQLLVITAILTNYSNIFLNVSSNYSKRYSIICKVST